MPRTWVRDYGSGGKTIPPVVQREIEKRILAVAESEYKGRYMRLDIRFKGQFCYIDAYTEPVLMNNWPPPGYPETREEYYERLRNTPVHLCRLRYFGDDEWGFAFYTYSHEKYELSMFPSGKFIGKPEDAFRVSAMYLE
jgi:hypothetical protein